MRHNTAHSQIKQSTPTSTKDYNTFELRIKQIWKTNTTAVKKSTAAQNYTKITPSTTDLDADLHHYTMHHPKSPCSVEKRLVNMSVTQTAGRSLQKASDVSGIKLQGS